MNATITRFGYPATLLHEYRSWVVLLRPAQPTLGSLVLACKEDASSLGAVSAAAWSEVAAATADIERALHATFDPQKINYLARREIPLKICLPKCRNRAGQPLDFGWSE